MTRHARSLDRRSFLDTASRLAATGLAAGALSDIAGPVGAFADQAAAGPPGPNTHAASMQLATRLRTQFTFQISVDVPTLEQARTVATAAIAGGITLVEMGTPLLKNQGIASVVPAFRQQFPQALLLADLKTMDGGGFEARAVYAGGGNIVDFLALAGTATAKAICAVRDEFRRSSPDLARLAFADILVPQQGPAATAIDAAQRMIDAGVDGVGIHLQADARRADPSLIASDYLSDVARAVFEKVGTRASVQVVGGLHVAQAKRLAMAGLRAFVISGNMGVADAVARYDQPAAEIQRLVAAFIADVSAP